MSFLKRLKAIDAFPKIQVRYCRRCCTFTVRLPWPDVLKLQLPEHGLEHAGGLLLQDNVRRDHHHRVLCNDGHSVPVRAGCASPDVSSLALDMMPRSHLHMLFTPW